MAATDALSEESEWEYEYDDSQTEDFSFTLDLPGFERPAKRRKTNVLPPNPTEATPDPYGPQPVRGNTSQQHQHEEQQDEPVTFHGLHTSKPSVDYGGHRYECRWTTDLGTQFHVSRAGLVQTPHHAGHVVDVVALSRVRLTGGRITKIPPSKVDGGNGGSEGQAIVLADDEDDVDVDEDGSARNGRRPGGTAQPTFLERAREIQRRKREEVESGVNGAQPTEPPNGQPEPGDRAPPSEGLSARMSTASTAITHHLPVDAVPPPTAPNTSPSLPNHEQTVTTAVTQTQAEPQGPPPEATSDSRLTPAAAPAYEPVEQPGAVMSGAKLAEVEQSIRTNASVPVLEHSAAEAPTLGVTNAAMLNSVQKNDEQAGETTDEAIPMQIEQSRTTGTSVPAIQQSEAQGMSDETWQDVPDAPRQNTTNTDTAPP